MADIQVLKADPTTGILKFEMGRSPKTISGITLLAQVVALSLLKNPGRDVLTPEEGSGIRDDIGQYNLGNTNEIKLLMINKIGLAEKQIISTQAAGVGDPTEKLKKLTLLDVAVDEIASRVVIRVKILNEAGDVTDILV